MLEEFYGGYFGKSVLEDKRRYKRGDPLLYGSGLTGWWHTRINAGQPGMRGVGSQRNQGNMLSMAKQEAERL